MPDEEPIAEDEAAEALVRKVMSAVYDGPDGENWDDREHERADTIEAVVREAIKDAAAVSAAKVEALVTALREIDGLDLSRMTVARACNTAIDTAHAALDDWGRSA